MTEMKKYAHGQFCWVDLGTTDPVAAKTFYGALFGWTAVDMPAGDAGTYTRLYKGDKDIGALYEQKQPGAPSAWTSYAAVTNVNASAAKAKDLGATVKMEPFDVTDAGRMAVLQDPTGAVFAIWEGKKHIGAAVMNEPNALCWQELQTRKVDAAVGFYSKLFGWSAKRSKAGAHEYFELFRSDEEAAGGMMEIQKAWGDVPPHWLAYFAVDDCNAQAEKAKALGATLLVPPTDIPGVGRFAIVQDPQGAVFSIIKMKP